MSKRKIMHVLYLHLAWLNYDLNVLNITMHREVVIHSMNAYVWCCSKICGSLHEIPSVTMGSCKSKIFNYSNMTLTVPNLYQKTDPKVQQDSLRQGQSSNQGHTMMLHIYNPYPMSLPSINFLHLMDSEI